DQDQTISTGDLKLEDSSRKCRSGTRGTLTTTCETTQKLEKSADCSSDETVKMAEGQTVADTVQEVSVGDESEQAEEKSTSKDPVKKQSGTKERAQQTHRAALSERSVSSARLKKKARAAPSATPVSSRYLGNLKVLEEKGDQKKSPEFDQADSLRAAVFQNWLEKKKAFLLESKRAEKKKAENLRNTAEKDEAAKREEAIASFEAWKKKKEREAKKLNEKKKLEELKKKKAAEQNEEKTEAAQKVVMSCSSLSQYRNEKKDEYIKQKKVERDLERRKQELQQAKKEEKNKKALEEYEKWLEKTERREQLEKKRKKLQAVRGDEVPSPWSPPGKVSYSRNY
ncbi:MAP9 protein, partial [Rhinopomastus cyanomelas]|nr:MAP9 protein [Rhinopomastus cyanomelas]